MSYQCAACARSPPLSAAYAIASFGASSPGSDAYTPRNSARARSASACASAIAAGRTTRRATPTGRRRAISLSTASASSCRPASMSVRASRSCTSTVRSGAELEELEDLVGFGDRRREGCEEGRRRGRRRRRAAPAAPASRRDPSEPLRSSLGERARSPRATGCPDSAGHDLAQDAVELHRHLVGATGTGRRDRPRSPARGSGRASRTPRTGAPRRRRGATWRTCVW